MDFALGGLAAVCAGFFTNPLEVLKIRMQLQGELQARGHHAVHYRNIFHAAVVVARTDGIIALQNGLVPALWTQLFLNGLRLGTYQFADSHNLLRDKNGNVLLHKSVLWGSIGGASGAAVCSPFFLIKTQLQSRAAESIAVGTQHNHKGCFPALKNIFLQYGIKGLWRGVEIAVPRAAIGSTVQLTSFSLCKQWLNERNILTNSPIVAAFFSSMIGGITICLAMTPFDLISVRIYNQGVDANGKGLLYNGIADCVVKIWRIEGFMGFYKGLIPNYLRLGPHTVLCLVFWEKFKLIQKSYFPKPL